MLEPDASPSQIDQALVEATSCFTDLRRIPAKDRSEFLSTIAAEMEVLRLEIIAVADQETALGPTRLGMEFDRTLGEIQNFAELCKSEAWKKLSFSSLRNNQEAEVRMLPLGPVVVIGACNFPIAISVVGTDTISALMVGCPVIVKAHPSHPRTCRSLAKSVFRAIEKTNFPKACFSLIQGTENRVAQSLVVHPLTAAVAFTGSLSGGTALSKCNQSRDHPIPFYAEMGSLNPIFALPGSLREGPAVFLRGFLQAVNLFAGQMCTKPGAAFILESSFDQNLVRGLQQEVLQAQALQMLNSKVYETYNQSIGFLRERIELLASSAEVEDRLENRGRIHIFSMTGDQFIQCPELRTEAFGPSSILVRVKDEAELLEVAESLDGSLTGSVHAGANDDDLTKLIMPIVESKVGRLLYNSFPPGVAPTPATHHGGPWPATTDPRFTSIGRQAYKRFLRPLVKLCKDSN